MADKYTKSSEAWKHLLEKNPSIEASIANSDICSVSADLIKKYREPRLMTKHDTIDMVPEPLRKSQWNVLSTSRSSYAVGEFDVFKKFPALPLDGPEVCILPNFETLDIDSISSEANAINALNISGILNHFLNTDNLVQTFNGRMGPGCFDFQISRKGGGLLDIAVRHAQLEIDAGFENDDYIVIVEAKNVVHEDFNIRQLYYPLRKYNAFVDKPIRLVFSQYTNLQYNLFEYVFDSISYFSSLKCINSASYTFEDDSITSDDVYDVWLNTEVLTDDSVESNDRSVPFPQADRIDRIFSLMEFLSDYPDGVTTEDIAEHMETVIRQANYYPAAAAYLNLVEHPKRNITRLTDRGRNLLRKNRRKRLLGIASAIFEHQIFHQLYGETLHTAQLPDRRHIEDTMHKLNVLGNGSEVTFRRRASTVNSWLKWLFDDLPIRDE